MPYRWNRKAQRYVAPNGRFVARWRVGVELERLRADADEEMRRLTQRWQNGEITGVDWLVAAKDVVKRIHVAHGLVAAGGVQSATAQDMGRIGAAVRQQYQRLRGYVEQVETGQRRVSLGRAAMYIQAARVTFAAVESASHIAAGYTQAKRVLGVAEHCADCVAWAGVWYPIAALPPIGSSVCRSRCRCTVIYRR